MSRKISKLGIIVPILATALVSFFALGAGSPIGSGTCGATLTWELTSDGTLTISGTGSMDDYIYYTPGYEPPWHEYTNEIYTVEIEDDVTSIGNYAFYGCDYLTSVTIPDTVTSIGSYAFGTSYSLNHIFIPDSVINIGNEAFNYNTTILAFYNSDAAEWAEMNDHPMIYLPHKPTMEANPPGLLNEYFYVFTVDTGIPYNEGIQFSISPSLPEGLHFADGSDNDDSGIIPGTIYGIPQDYSDFESGKTFTITAWSMELGLWLAEFQTSVDYTLEIDLTSRWDEVVANGLFEDNTLQWVLFSDGLLKITGLGYPDDVFHPWVWEPPPPFNMPWLKYPWYNYRNIIKEIVISDDVSEIGEYAFYDCSYLLEVTIPDSVTTIGRSAFSGCASLAEIDIPDSVLSIGQYAFYRCSALLEITIPDDVSVIDRSTFSGCSLLSDVYIPDGVNGIGINAFYGCASLENITLPGSLKSIGTGAFNGSGLTDILLPEGLESIGDYAFGGCTNLTRIDIPSSLESIGEYLFINCLALQSIDVAPGNTAFTSIDGVLLDSAGQALLFYPYGKTASVYYIPDSVTSIDSNAFGANLILTDISIPASVTQIGDLALHGCASLENIFVHPDNPAYSDIDGVLYNKDKSILLLYPPGKEKNATYVIPDGVTFFNFYELYSNVQFSTIIIPDSVSNISTSYNMPQSGYGETGDGLPVDTPDDPYPTYTSVDVVAHYDSYAIWWAKQTGNNLVYMACERTMRANPPDELYKYIPYEFIARTRVPDNEKLVFSITPALPSGLILETGATSAATGKLPGTIYGSPLDYNEISPDTEYTLTAYPVEYPPPPDVFSASITFPLTLAPTPTNDDLDFDMGGSNAYPFKPDPGYSDDGRIGIYNPQTENYEITEVADQVMHIGDLYPISHPDYYNNHDYFASFWIDGVKLTEGVDYDHEEGSTRVTIFAQTIEDLDNGEHTAAAAFFRVDPATGLPDYDQIDDYMKWNISELTGNELDIVAQNFIVNIEGRITDPGIDPGDGSGGYDGGGNTNPGNTNTGVGDRGQDTGDREEETGGTTPDGTIPGGDSDPGTTNPGGGTTPGDNTTGGMSTQPGNTATQPADAAPAAGTAPVGTIGAGTAAPADGAPAAGTAADTPADNAQPGTDPANAGTANNAPAGTSPSGGGTGGISGLLTGPDGKMYFNLDGSGNPMELRIDIPFNEFNDLYFDGALWTDGTDYLAREGSTILTITAAQLEKYDEGEHTLTAGFTNETVEITFLLNKPTAAGLPAGQAGAPPSAPSAAPAPVSAPSDITMPAQNSNFLPFIIAGIAVLVIAAAAILIARKKRAA